MQPRLFSQRLDARHRRVYRAVVGYFFIVFLAMVWPVVSLFSHTRPLILGLPFFLFYLAVLLLASFLVLLGLFQWEARTGASSDPTEDDS